MLDNKHEDTQNRILQNSAESVLQEIHYKSYDQWIKNFALNLPNIWKESSASYIKQMSSNAKKNSSAIVIGRGPSIKKHNHLELLANSDYTGSILCCDGALINTLKSGVTPDKFPKFYVVSIEPYERITKFYDDPIVDKYGDKISAIFPTIAASSTVERARFAGMKIFWLHLLFDYNEGKKSFNHISSLMVRSKQHSNGLPGIQTGANVGTSCWFIAWKVMNIANVGLIGINHGWEEDDSWEKILCHGNFDLLKNIDQNDPSLKQLFKKIHNPEFNCNCILDPVFQFYSSALKEFISRSPEWVNTINATEGGSIFGDRIVCTKFHEFLQKYHS